MFCTCLHICVFVLVYTLNFTFSALCSGTRPTQEVGQCSAVFDWQHFFSKGGSSALTLSFTASLGLFFSVPVPSFTRSFALYSGSQCRTMEGIRLTTGFSFFSPPVTLTELCVFFLKVCEKRVIVWPVIPHQCKC